MATADEWSEWGEDLVSAVSDELTRVRPEHDDAVRRLIAIEGEIAPVRAEVEVLHDRLGALEELLNLAIDVERRMLRKGLRRVSAADVLAFYAGGPDEPRLASLAHRIGGPRRGVRRGRVG